MAFALASVVPVIVTSTSGYSSEARLVAWSVVPILSGMGLGFYQLLVNPSPGFEEWPAWKIFVFTFSAFGLLALLFSSIPQFSMDLYMASLATVLIVILAGLAGLNWGWKWLWLPVVFLVPFALFAIPARILSILLGPQLIWMAPFSFLVAASLFLPVLKPEWSEFILVEQFEPNTELGKMIVGWAIRTFGVGGVSGYTLATFINENYGYNFGLMFIAALAPVVAASFTHVITHQVLHGTYIGSSLDAS